MLRVLTGERTSGYLLLVSILFGSRVTCQLGPCGILVNSKFVLGICRSWWWCLVVSRGSLVPKRVEAFE